MKNTFNDHAYKDSQFNNSQEKTKVICMEDNKFINHINLNFVEDLSEELFFKDLLKKCYEENLLDNDIFLRINYERIEVLKTQLKYYTKDESSSVMEEDADKILNGIDYTIGVYLKNSCIKGIENKGAISKEHILLEKLQNERLLYMVESGFKLIKKKKEECMNLLFQIQNSKIQTNNYSYNDTIDRGLGIFFKEYNEFFTPQESCGSIDYVLSIDDMKPTGIEYMERYLKTLHIENEFCRKFDSNEIEMLLKGYNKEYELLLINIFEIVFINVLGRIICGKNIESLNMLNKDMEDIKFKLKNLSLEELKTTMVKCSEECYSMLDLKNNMLKSYMRMTSVKLAHELYNNMKLDNIEKFFNMFYEEDKNDFIEYIDKEKMSNSIFKKVTEKIRECADTDVKIKIIKDNMKSLQDLIDTLEADCIFGNEFEKVFKSLYETEVILLFKHMVDFELFDNCQKEWHEMFKNYICKLSSEKYDHILKTAEKIKII